MTIRADKQARGQRVFSFKNVGTLPTLWFLNSPRSEGVPVVGPRGVDGVPLQQRVQLGQALL